MGYFTLSSSGFSGSSKVSGNGDILPLYENCVTQTASRIVFLLCISDILTMSQSLFTVTFIWCSVTLFVKRPSFWRFGKFSAVLY